VWIPLDGKTQSPSPDFRRPFPSKPLSLEKTVSAFLTDKPRKDWRVWLKTQTYGAPPSAVPISGAGVGFLLVMSMVSIAFILRSLLFGFVGMAMPGFGPGL
jgi:hypothetical protein